MPSLDPAIAPARVVSAPQSSASTAERIGVLDVLRGIALLGMYVVHFNYYEATPAGAEPGRAASVLERTIALFFEGRFYTMFGMLFGIGFAVQLLRAEARGERFVFRYLRRLTALAVIGFIAEGVFGYNVLFGYAMWGLPLLLVRRWPTRALIVLLVVCAASRPLYNLGRIAWYDRQPDGMAQFAAVNKARSDRFAAARAAHDSTEQSTEWGTVVAGRMRFMPKFHRQWSYLPTGSFTLFLLGLIAFRLRLVDRPEAHRGTIAALMVVGAVSMAIEYFLLPIGGPAPPAPPEDGAVWHAVVTIARVNAFQLIRGEWLAFTYVGAVLLLVAHNREWLARLSPFAWAGRMALTNYMSQVILLDVLFTPHGFGWRVPALLVPIAACGLFLLQAIVGRWWLSRYQLGPLEWMWRTVTYWERQPLRRSSGHAGVRVIEPVSG